MLCCVIFLLSRWAAVGGFNRSRQGTFIRFCKFFFCLQIYGASWRWFENESVIDGYICEGLVSTCLTAPCTRWAQKLLEGRKEVKTGPVLCRRRPAWHTLLSHTAQRREDTHRWNLFFMCSFLLTNQPLLFFSRQKKNGWHHRERWGESVVSTVFRSQWLLTGGACTLTALMKPSMYSILHSTGVCVKCQSDFSGVKSKTHGISRLERAFQTTRRVFNAVFLYNKNARLLIVKTWLYAL